MMVKISDYIFKRLAEVYQVKHVFMITGGGAMHLNDSIGSNHHIRYICNHHEQATAIAAEGYARAAHALGVVNVTTGPGGLNTLTGLMGQWTDSVPVLYISGQVKQSTTITAYPQLNLRQLGDQEVDIIAVVKPLCKFAAQITDPKQVKFLLDKAIHIATSGRPGPVWLDIPMDIQGALIDENEFTDFCQVHSTKADPHYSDLIQLITQAQRPLIIAGNGIKIAQVEETFLQLLQNLQIPVVTTFNGMDILPEDHPLYVGRIGTLGNRSGNFALQNADLVICLGSRNNIRQISYNWDFFAREGKLVIVDIDAAELQKPTVKADLGIQADLKLLIPALCDHFTKQPLKSQEWIDWCLVRKHKYPSVLPSYHTLTDAVHPYVFFEQLSTQVPENSYLVCGNGTACVAAFQAAKVVNKVKYIWNSGCAAMGYDLPAAIGVAIAKPTQQVYCLAGDGSLMMNLQEMETIKHLNLNIKLIVLDNGGYVSIKQTQSNFFNGREVGCGTTSGVGFPNFIKLAEAFGLKTISIQSHQDIAPAIQIMSQSSEPMVCVVHLDHNYKFEPKVSSEKKADGRMVSKPLEDLYPFLPREEFYSNMIIDPIKD